MPWEMHWIPAPSDMSLPVLAELPDGLRRWEFTDPPRAFGVIDGECRDYYHCRHCGGWIEGRATETKVNTLGPLCGRQGVESYCRRCGREIAFHGIMS